jgi:hypothetical protein
VTGARDTDPVWRAFLAEPASYIHPSRLIGALNNQLSAELCDSLRNCERLQGRLSAVIASRAALPDRAHTDVVDPQYRDIATASADELAAIISRSGAVYWASAMAGAVRGQHVAALEGALGAELCRFAVKHRELAGPAQPLEPYETLRERVVVDGWRCYEAWCDAVPPAIGARARLKSPAGEDEGGPGDPFFAKVGPAIIRRAAMQGGENG